MKTKEKRIIKKKVIVKKTNKKPRRKKSKIYFGKEVQDAIVRYNNAESHTLRNKIYQEEIHRAFDKLAENIINTFKFMYFDVPFEDVKHEVVAFMLMNMHKYDHTKGSKAFSYFSVVAKNYLILNNNNNYKKLKSHDNLDSLRNSNKMVTYIYEDSRDSYYDELTAQLIKYFETNIPNIFKKKRDINIAYAVIELLKRKDEIENFNKKNLYILIREMTGVNTTHITKIMNVLRKHYRKIYEQFENTGIIDDGNTFF